MKTEIVVIGGGIAGCSTAYYLAKAGHRVTLLEKESAVGLEASGRCGCGVRQQGRKAALPLAMASVRIWATLGEELDSELEYWQSGNLKVRFTEADLEILEEETAWENAQGLTEVRMVTGDECREMIPRLTDRVLGGKYCPTDGIANPMLVTSAIARRAERLGVDVRTNSAVTGLLLQGSVVRGVSTKAGEVEAAVVVNAAGPWAQAFNESVGCRTPIKPEMDQIMITEKLPRMFTPWLGFGVSEVYVLQPKSGNIVIGTGKPPTPILTYQKGVDFTSSSKGAHRIIEFLPWLAEVNFLRSFSGIIESTPDQEPYIGAIPGVTGYYTVCGFSGQGFCVGPMAGKVIAELVSGKDPSVSLAPFKPDRFASMEWPEFNPVRR
jgi:sarcosine oxidase subunit beta